MTHIIRPGSLKRSLYLQENTPARGNPGSWANVATDPECRCAIKTLSGAEPNGPGGLRGETKLEVTMRYRSDVTYSKRFSDGGTRVFDIEHINNVDEMNHKLILTLVERTTHNG
jgi:head-tail adaptor